MSVAAPNPASERLQRLSAWLEHDPHNAELLVEACDAALACGRHDAAEDFLATAERAGAPSPALQLRRAHVCIARGVLAQARTLLEDLRSKSGDHPVLLHDLAHVHLVAGNPQAAHDLLSPFATQRFAGTGTAQGLLQAQWLRTCHHLGLLEEAWAWVERARATQALQPAAAGVASLIALDVEQEAAARALADVALAADPLHHEALVARGGAALAAGELARGKEDLQRAADLHPDDGRTWASLGIASLLSRDIHPAREQLERAVAAQPGHAASWQALGWARLLLGETEPALEALRRCVAEDEASAEAHAALALAMALSGDTAGARACVEQAEVLDAQDEVAALARACLAGDPRSPNLQPALQRLLAQWRPRP